MHNVILLSRKDCLCRKPQTPQT